MDMIGVSGGPMRAVVIPSAMEGSLMKQTLNIKSNERDRKVVSELKQAMFLNHH